MAPGSFILGGPLEATAELGEGDHRIDHVANIALEKQLPSRLQSSGDGYQQGRLQHPTLAMAALEPGIGKLDRNPLQEVLIQAVHPTFKADVGIAEQHSHVAVFSGQGLTICRCHQWSTDFNAEVIPVRIVLRQTQHTAASGTADIKVKRLVRAFE